MAQKNTWGTTEAQLELAIGSGDFYISTNFLFGVQVRLMAKEHLGRYKNTMDCLQKVRLLCCGRAMRVLSFQTLAL